MATGHSKDFFLSGLLRLVCPHSRRAGGCNKHRDLWKPTVSTREVSKQTRLSVLQGLSRSSFLTFSWNSTRYLWIWGNMLNLGTTLFFRTWTVAWPIALMACAWRGGQAVDCEVPTKLDDPSDLSERPNVDLYRPEALAECVCTPGTTCRSVVSKANIASVAGTILLRIALGTLLERFGPVNVQCSLMVFVLFGLPCLQPLIHPGPTSSSAFVSAWWVLHLSRINSGAPAWTCRFSTSSPLVHPNRNGESIGHNMHNYAQFCTSLSLSFSLSLYTYIEIQSTRN